MIAFVGRDRFALVMLAAGLLAALAALGAGINAESLTNLDTSVATWFDTHRTRRRDMDASGIFHYIGRPIHVLIPALVCGSLLSWRARSAIPVLCVTGAVGVGVVIEGTLKAIITRTATAGPLVDYPHSYPSGHVTGSAALLGSIAVCLGARRSPVVQTILAVAATVCVVFVAGLALYTGAHTFTDIVGGLLLGGAIVTLNAAIVIPNRDFSLHRT